jgi:prevent-host-death family protein
MVGSDTVLVNVHEAKAQLSELLERASRGELIVIAKRGRPIVRLVPIEDRSPRRPGIAKGRVTDAFFEPLPDDELAAWEQ